MEYIITTKNLSKNYGNLSALSNVSISIPKGSIYGLIGNNGAGKTTLMRLLLGLQTPSAGSIQTSHSFTTGAILEKPSFYPYWSAKKNLSYQLSLIDHPVYSEKELLDMVGLKDTRTPVLHYSLGMKQRLGIALALASQPEVLVLDEPLNGLDPFGIREIRELLHRLNKENHTTIILSSHILDEMEKTITHVGFIKSGSLLLECPISEIKNTSLENFYFEEFKKGEATL